MILSCRSIGTGVCVCARMAPWSNDLSSSVCSVTPVESTPCIMICWRGAGPRKLSH